MRQLDYSMTNALKTRHDHQNQQSELLIFLTCAATYEYPGENKQQTLTAIGCSCQSWENNEEHDDRQNWSTSDTFLVEFQFRDWNRDSLEDSDNFEIFDILLWKDVAHRRTFNYRLLWMRRRFGHRHRLEYNECYTRTFIWFCFLRENKKKTKTAPLQLNTVHQKQNRQWTNCLVLGKQTVNVHSTIQWSE
jgi:hypothetical protein